MAAGGVDVDGLDRSFRTRQGGKEQKNTENVKRLQRRNEDEERCFAESRE